MKITQCDIYKKRIMDNSKNVHIGLGESALFNSFEICGDCGKLVVKFLKAKKMIDKNNKKIKYE